MLMTVTEKALPLIELKNPEKNIELFHVQNRLATFHETKVAIYYLRNVHLC